MFHCIWRRPTQPANRGPRERIRGIGLTAPLEELHGSLVLFGCFSASERAQILPCFRSWIELARIQAILAARKLAYHVRRLSKLRTNVETLRPVRRARPYLGAD
jgi:hypothetical protein